MGGAICGKVWGVSWFRTELAATNVVASAFLARYARTKPMPSFKGHDAGPVEGAIDNNLA